MKKRLITLMLAAGLTATALTGCNEKSGYEINCENQIREMLEYDANINISQQKVRDFGFGIEYKIVNNKFYITFISKKHERFGQRLIVVDDIKITYEVDKNTYYNFKNQYALVETERTVELVKTLTEQYDPINVEGVEEESVERK